MTQAFIIKGKNDKGINTITIYLLDRTVIKRGGNHRHFSPGYDFIDGLFPKGISECYYKTLLRGYKVDTFIYRNRRVDARSYRTIIKLIRL